ncbi:MAG: VTT domain-containing protein [Bryobacterales bacterium]|nr:VTT domain-containing protein [Bryobacterales bacterium]
MKAIVRVLTSWGPLGLFLLAMLDSAGVPLPTAVDALLVATAVVSPAQAYLSAALAVAGSAIGCMFLFYVARKGGQAYLERHASGEKGLRFRAWFRTYGLITVFVPCFLPIPMPLKVFVLSSGALGVDPRKFLLTVLAARVPRYFGLAFLGAQLGEGSGAWLKQHAWHIGGFAIALAAALVLAVRVVARRQLAPYRETA